MLDTSRISTGEMQYNFELFDLVACTKEVLAALRVVDNSHALDLHAPLAVEINGDRARLSQVISNLVGNAVKYSPGKDKVIIHIIQEAGLVKFKVKDEGIGISADQQTKIFKRFYRAESLPKNNFKGLGLGLYICAEIIKKHNGAIGVRSEVGKGSEFWFTLPL